MVFFVDSIVVQLQIGFSLLKDVGFLPDHDLVKWWIWLMSERNKYDVTPHMIQTDTNISHQREKSTDNFKVLKQIIRLYQSLLSKQTEIDGIILLLPLALSSLSASSIPSSVFQSTNYHLVIN
jgi:hypothetical protein